MKTYFLFVWEHHLQNGGMDDYVGAFETQEAARAGLPEWRDIQGYQISICTPEGLQVVETEKDGLHPDWIKDLGLARAETGPETYATSTWAKFCAHYDAEAGALKTTGSG